eukprot:scaffold1322_cov372-Pavlova_lutheri.AAC.20
MKWSVGRQVQARARHPAGSVRRKRRPSGTPRKTHPRECEDTSLRKGARVVSDHDLPAVDGGHLQRDRFAGSRSSVAEETDACSFPACHPRGSSVERKHEAHRTRPGTQRKRHFATLFPNVDLRCVFLPFPKGGICLRLLRARTHARTCAG